MCQFEGQKLAKMRVTSVKISVTFVKTSGDGVLLRGVV